jgi:ribosome biogenesis GTPase A
MRELENHWKKVDVFVEVRDARIPKTSENPELIATIPHGMKRLVVYNKLDLVPQRKATELIKQLHENHVDKDVPYLLLSTKDNINIGKMITFITKNAQPKFKTVGGWLMIGGVPNVGKSTIINSLRKRDSSIGHTKKSGAKTGGVPCITKTISGFKIISDPPTYMTDTPGIFIPSLTDTESGLKFCAVNCIRDGIVEPQLVCDYILYQLNKNKCFDYVKRYNLTKPTDEVFELLSAVQSRLGLQGQTAAQTNFLTEFRDGTLGKIILD